MGQVMVWRHHGERDGVENSCGKRRFRELIGQEMCVETSLVRDGVENSRGDMAWRPKGVRDDVGYSVDT